MSALACVRHSPETTGSSMNYFECGSAPTLSHYVDLSPSDFDSAQQQCADSGMRLMKWDNLQDWNDIVSIAGKFTARKLPVRIYQS